MVCPAKPRLHAQAMACPMQAAQCVESPQCAREHARPAKVGVSSDAQAVRTSHLELRPGEVYKMLRPQVARISRNLLGAEPPSELVHDICVDVALSLTRYRGDCAFPSWVYEVVSRRVHRWIRKETRYRSLLRETHCCFKPKGPLWPDEASMTLGDYELIRGALSALPERERVCLTLVRFEFRSVQEVANRLRISPDAVRMNVHRARVRIRRALAADGPVE
jgi:RNA polymerase sigma-70 factor (ECF subfamily)